MLTFELLREKQYQCKHLFDMLPLIIDKSMPAYFFDSIKKLIRQVKKA